MEKTFCDMCGQELEIGVKKNAKIGAWVHYAEDGEREAYDSFKSFAYDLCNDCSHKVIEFITGISYREIL